MSCRGLLTDFMLFTKCTETMAEFSGETVYFFMSELGCKQLLLYTVGDIKSQTQFITATKSSDIYYIYQIYIFLLSWQRCKYIFAVLYLSTSFDFSNIGNNPYASTQISVLLHGGYFREGGVKKPQP